MRIVPVIRVDVVTDAARLMRRSDKIRKRYLNYGGAFARKVAARSLRKARRIRVSELPDEAREEYQEAMEEFRNGYRDKPPKLRTIISEPGKPPLMQTPPYPLKRGLRFALDANATVALIGPVRDKSGVAGDLEHGTGKIKRARPFMGPAFIKTLPRLPGFLASAAR